MSTLAFVILSFAAYRVVRLYIWDTITKPLRAAINQKLMFGWKGQSPVGTGSTYGRIRLWATDLLSCQWCLGIWVSFGMTGLAWIVTDWSPDWWTYILTSLAVSAVQSWMHGVEDRFLFPEDA